jgi:rhodanese-related sulfurtransferase
MNTKQATSSLLAATVICMAILAGCGGSGGSSVTGPSPTTSYVDLTAAEANAFLDSTDNVTIIDVAPFAEYWPAHLYGAFNYSVQNGEFDRIVPALDRDGVYLVYARDGVSSASAASELASAGFGNVYRMAENFSIWINAGYPISIPLPP